MAPKTLPRLAGIPVKALANGVFAGSTNSLVSGVQWRYSTPLRLRVALDCHKLCSANISVLCFYS